MVYVVSPDSQSANPDGTSYFGYQENTTFLYCFQGAHRKLGSGAVSENALSALLSVKPSRCHLPFAICHL